MTRAPMTGLGTWKSPLGKTGAAVKVAVEAGYRHIDCANDYGNEHEIGEALATIWKEGHVRREEMFIQAKLWNSNHRPEHIRADLEATLRDLQLTYLDSFIIHWPQACPSTGKQPALRTDGNFSGPAGEGTMFPCEADGTYASDNASHFIETWRVMQDLVDQGLVRTIGLSNFTATQIKEVMEHSDRHRPTILQNECHPYLQQKDLVDLCGILDIQFQAYSPLGSRDRPWRQEGDHDVLDDPVIGELGAKHGKSPAQVILRWHLQRNVATVPKSVTPSRIRENVDIHDFELSEQDMRAFDVLNKGWRHCLWPETSKHPDYPFKDEIPHGYVPGPALKKTSTSSTE